MDCVSASPTEGLLLKKTGAVEAPVRGKDNSATALFRLTSETEPEPNATRQRPSYFFPAGAKV
jgi:hypothetical protein